jgi:hypothetical protein
MKVVLNPMFEQARGQLGDLVFREVRGVTIAGRKPTVSGEPTVAQAAHRERFKQAAAFGKSVMADSSLRALYEEVAKSRNMPVFAATVADFFNKPTIDAIDLSTYGGHLGELIHVTARDDFDVMSVHVTISNEQNELIEGGQAIETSPGSGRWVYTATVELDEEPMVNIRVVATDRPGGTAVSSQTKTF